ncbi:conserved hypothetical protein (plasmid) [Rhodococcus jostii RHA1]|uniref:Uncharacterized protein n=4 Tax=Nocardiaceae TaxID=85025 RepID=Q0RY89_RHOJR|nr:conserved hypothetical protein [Rhodococcus jostii RHA1]
MCQPKPGPRCSPHMRIRLIRARTKLNDALHALAEDPDNNTLKHRVRRAEAAVAEHAALYDSTPVGQNELREAIAHENNDTARNLLNQRMAAAEALRAQQIHAMHNGQQDPTAKDNHYEQRTNADPGTTGIVLASTRVAPEPAGQQAPGDRAVLDRPGDRGGRSPRILISGREITPVAEHTLSSPICERLAAKGVSTPTLYELDQRDADLYREQMLALRNNNPYAASVYVYDTHEYRGMRMLVTDDGKAGVAVNGDEVVSVFAHNDCAHPRAAYALLSQATEIGGHRLDCFDTVLPKIYAQSGFVPVARLAWNDDYAPDGWNYSTYRNFNNGRPDVVFMAYDPAAIGSKYTNTAANYVDNYDTGIESARNYSSRRTSAPSPAER